LKFYFLKFLIPFTIVILFHFFLILFRLEQIEILEVEFILEITLLDVGSFDLTQEIHLIHRNLLYS
jgi:hypothetical protein